MPQHNGARICLVILTIVVFILSAVFVFLGLYDEPPLFRKDGMSSADNSSVRNGSSSRNTSNPGNGTSSWWGESSGYYWTEVTPATFTVFGIWIAIYTYQSLFMIYAFASLLRVSGPGFLYTTPNYLPPAVYISFVLAQLCTVVWTFLWDNEHIEASLSFALLATIAAFVAVSMSGHGIFTNQKALISYGHGKEYRWVCLLVINPLGLYAMWLTILSLNNLSVVLVYSIGVSQSAGGSISLAILMALVIGYSLVDLAFYERYFRYLYTTYLVLIWVFVGILLGNLDWHTSNTVFTLGLIIVTIVIFVLKIILSICRAMHKPLFLLNNEDPGTMQFGGMIPNGGPSHTAYIAPPQAVIQQPAPPLPSWSSLIPK